MLLLAVSAAAQAPPPPAPPPPASEPLRKASPGVDLDLSETDPEPPLPAVPLAADTLRPSPAPAVLDAYRADPDFQYDRPQAEGPSLWERFWRWGYRTVLAPIFENTSARAREWVLIALAVGILGWVLSRLLQAEGSGVFGRSATTGGVGGPLLDAEDIAEVDLHTRLAEALDRGDHREAVRVRYLLLLQALDAAGAIAWRRDKTNRQYVTEVAAADADHAPLFTRATRVFDAVWYGERPVSPALYAELAPLFDGASPRAA